MSAFVCEGARTLRDHVVHLHEEIANQLRRIDPVVLVIGTVGGTLIYVKAAKIYGRSEKPLHKRLAAYAFSCIRMLPAVRRRIEKDLGPAKHDILVSIHKDDTDRSFRTQLPPNGLSPEEIEKIAASFDKYGQFAVAEGKVSGTVYTDRAEEHLQLLTKIFHDYAYSNPLHPDVFPGVRKMEAEVIRMVLNLYHAPADSSGSLTTGGTESIIMACFCYRNLAHRRGIESPVIVLPITAHAAFDKAAHLCGMRIRHVPVDGDNRVILSAMERAICSSTCMLVGSAPNYPSGTIDPIPEIAKLGLKYNIPVHVDACLGGFLIPFLNESGFPTPSLDFRNEGVTSVSCDTHKYGCTPKGSSIVMYRSLDLHHNQYFSVPEWVGGIYATPTIAGSRAGSNTAVAWATLLFFGRSSYIQRCSSIVTATKKIADGVKKINGLQLHGSPDVSVVAFKSDEFNIYAVGDRMHKLGYNLNSLQNPNAIHVCLTYNHTSEANINAFVRDLKSACDEVRALPDKGNGSSTAAVYGMAATVPDKTLVDEVAFSYLDACYARPPV